MKSFLSKPQETEPFKKYLSIFGRKIKQTNKNNNNNKKETNTLRGKIRKKKTTCILRQLLHTFYKEGLWKS